MQSPDPQISPGMGKILGNRCRAVAGDGEAS